MSRCSDFAPYGPRNPDYAYDERRQQKDELIDAAFADIIAGRFDSEIVQEALRLGHHDRYHELKDTLSVAEMAARHAA